MNNHHHIGQRLSYDGVLCTVRFVGVVAGTTGTWVGVEWDDATRGKHDGAHKDRRYFTCLSASPTAASFVRPTRPAETPRTFLEALQAKYTTTSTEAPSRQIVISGKVAEEVGFDKIRRQQAQLEELRVVILDGMRIAAPAPAPAPAQSVQQEGEKPIRDVCPKVVELDLSRNLFTDFATVVQVCAHLAALRALRLNGNRFQNILQDASLASPDTKTVFKAVKELALDETMLQWDEICHIAASFPSLATLYTGTNQLPKLSSIPASWPPTITLTSMYLEFNEFTSLTDVASLASLTSLQDLHLKGNNISTIVSSDMTEGDEAPPTWPVFSNTLTHLDISYNKVHHWSFVDALPDVFPGLTSLRLAHNPVYDNPGFSSTSHPSGTTTSSSSSSVTEEAYMITIARLAALQSLNFSAVTPTDRTNAEMFYLSRIGRQLSSVPEEDEPKIVAQHRRYVELCETYGEPVVVRRKEVNPAFLEARLIGTTFRWIPTKESDKQEVERTAQVPKTVDIYAVKGLAGRLFGCEPMDLRLIWETGEWDPVAGFDDEDAGDSSEDEMEVVSVPSSHQEGEDKQQQQQKQQKQENNSSSKSGPAGKWIKREVELTDSPRQLGFCVDGMDVTIRVEPRRVSKV